MHVEFGFYFLLFFFHSLLGALATNETDPDEDDCLIDINRDLSLSEPLLLTTDTPPQILYPNSMEPHTIRLDENQRFRLACVSSYYVICRDASFYMDGLQSKFSLRKISCARKSLKRVIKPTKTGCPSNVLCYQVGFQLNIFDFVPTIKMIYVSQVRLRPLWAHRTIQSIIGHRQLRGEIDDYETGELFSGSISAEMREIFDRDYQRNRFAEILGSQDLAEKYITEKAGSIFQFFSSILRVKEGLAGGEHLVRGQLIDNDDLFYKPEQDTVHFYANVAPVWRSIASGNWQIAGEMIRKAASDSRSNIELWAGTMRVLELENVKGIRKQMYMAQNTTSKMEVVPIPRLLFKYAYNREHNRGIVIITINDPFIKEPGPEHIVCPEQELCHHIEPKFTIMDLGYSYCCSLADFSKIAKARGLPIFPNARSLF